MAGGGDEQSRLLRWEAASCQGDKPLRWWTGGDAKAVQKSYPAVVPWDMLVLMVLLAPWVLVVLVVPAVALWAWDMSRSLDESTARYLALLPSAMHWVGLVGAVAWLWAAALIPRRITREPEALRLDFLLHSKTVPLREVLELEVLGLGGWDSLFGLLWRWRVFPFGSTVRLFCGVPSSQGVVFVLLTSRCFWSYIFCLEDPVQFLVDNQRPLDLGARYKTVSKVLVREGESFTSKQITNVCGGCSVRVEEQRGRRVRVTFGSEAAAMAWPKVSGTEPLQGWISSVSTIGRFLLEKERDGGGPLPGTVGASSFNGSYGTASIELPAMPGLGADEAEEPE